MNTQDHNDSLNLLHQTAPGTLMGRLLRRFWQPVATSTSITAGKARGIRILRRDINANAGNLIVA